MKLIAILCVFLGYSLPFGFAAEPGQFKIIYGILFENSKQLISKDIPCSDIYGCKIDVENIHLDVRIIHNFEPNEPEKQDQVKIEMHCEKIYCAFQNGSLDFDIADFGSNIETDILEGRPDLDHAGFVRLLAQTRRPLATFYARIIR